MLFKDQANWLSEHPVSKGRLLARTHLLCSLSPKTSWVATGPARIFRVQGSL